MNKQAIKTVKVSATGVQFGNAWFSHESITGYSAEQLNAGTCGVTGGAYMTWLSTDEPYTWMAREAALREELERVKSRYDREVLGLNNEGDPIGGDPAGGYKNDNARLQQSLTVVEQRAGDLEHSLMWVRSQLTDARVIFHIDAMLKPATERPVMHPGKPPIGSVVTVHGSIKAIVISHHAEGIIAGAGEGHLVKDGSYKP